MSLILLMAEILHQMIGSLSHYLQGFIHPRWCRISAINSKPNFCWVIGLFDLPKKHQDVSLLNKGLAWDSLVKNAIILLLCRR